MKKIGQSLVIAFLVAMAAFVLTTMGYEPNNETLFWWGVIALALIVAMASVIVYHIVREEE